MILPIVGGMLDANEPAVVAVAHRPIACSDEPAVTCSGLLIAPRVVLTAAHCVEGMASRGSLEVVFGGSAAQPSAEIVVQSIQTFSGYVPNTGDGDLAFLILAEPAQVAPFTGSAANVDMLAGSAALRAVGYGVSSATAADPGSRRSGTLALAAVRAASFDATPSPAMTCVGDSGGPVFTMVGSDEQLAGLTSRGDVACTTSAVNARVDVAESSFVIPAITAGSNAEPGWLPDARTVGAPCTYSADCPALMTCTDGHCELPWLGAGTFGDTCTTTCAGDARCVRVWPTGSDACHCFTSSMMPPGPDVASSSPGGCGCGSTNEPESVLVLVALAWAAQRVLLHARNQRRA